MKVDWSDYALFAALARKGSLAGAAEETGVSQATLSRRMRAFETAINRRLFHHGSDGYALTQEGSELADRVARMSLVAGEIEAWQSKGDRPVCVRISAGTWTALDLAEHVSLFWQPNALWLPEFVQSETVMDIARRDIDIGLRGARPTQAWLAGREVGAVDFAEYATGAEVKGYIAASRDAAHTASTRWVWTHHGDAITTKANTPFIAAAMARAGIGRVILPTFVGDRMPPINRVSDVIPELSAPQWLVSHQDMRHTPPIRAALDALTDYLTRHRPT